MSDPPLFTDIPNPYEDARSVPPPPKLPSAADAGPTRAQLSRTRFCALVGALALACLAAGLSWSMRREMSASFLALSVGLPAVAMFIAWRAASNSGRIGLGATSAELWTSLGGAGALFALSALGPPALNDVAFSPKNTVVCAALGLGLGALPFALAVVAYRHAFATLAFARMAAFGVAAGSFAAVFLRVYCPHDSALHVLLGHGGAILVFAALGVGARRYAAVRD